MYYVAGFKSGYLYYKGASIDDAHKIAKALSKNPPMFDWRKHQHYPTQDNIFEVGKADESFVTLYMPKGKAEFYDHCPDNPQLVWTTARLSKTMICPINKNGPFFTLTVPQV